MARRDEPTPAQREAANQAAQGHPPAHEQHPVTQAERDLIDRAEEQRMNEERR